MFFCFGSAEVFLCCNQPVCRQNERNPRGGVASQQQQADAHYHLITHTEVPALSEYQGARKPTRMCSFRLLKTQIIGWLLLTQFRTKSQKRRVSTVDKFTLLIMSLWHEEVFSRVTSLWRKRSLERTYGSPMHSLCSQRSEGICIAPT